VTCISLAHGPRHATPRDTRPKTPLDPNRTIKRGKQIWEAVSADGVYAYIRMEDTTTTWAVRHLPTGHVFDDVFGTLPGARRWTWGNPTPPAA
jgi:hypothetical protein